MDKEGAGPVKTCKVTALQVCLLLYAALLMTHGLSFLAGNGVCVNEVSSTINGTPAHMAGALPRLAGLEYHAPLRPQLPFMSGVNLLAFIFFCLDFLLLVGLLIRVCFAPRTAMLRRTLVFAALPIVLSFAVPNAESSFSCILSRTQMNIQQIFADQARPTGRVITTKMVGGSAVVVEKIETSGQDNLFQMKGDLGESTCDVYLASLVHDRKESSFPSLPLTAQWVSLDEKMDQNLPGLRALLIQDRFIRTNAARLKLNISPMKTELSYSELREENPKTPIYSIIACLPWPYGWADQFE